MSSVTFDVNLGGDGSTVSDDENPNTGLRLGGHRTRWVPALQQFVAMLAFAKGLFIDTQAAALSALNAPATSATSSTSLSLTDTGALNLTLDQVGKAFTGGMTVGVAYVGDPTQQMIGVITAFNSNTGAMTLAMQSKTATAGPFSAWNVFRTATGGIPATRSIVGAGLASGGGSLAADRTITVAEATADELAAGTATKAVSARRLADLKKPITLTFAANVAWAMTRQAAKLTLTGDAVLQPPTAPLEGEVYALDVTQGGAGNYELDMSNPCFDWGADGVPSFKAATGKMGSAYLRCIDASAPLFRCSFQGAG